MKKILILLTLMGFLPERTALWAQQTTPNPVPAASLITPAIGTDCAPTTLEIPDSHPVSGLGQPPLYFIMRTQKDWTSYYRDTSHPPDPATTVDFKNQMLVVFSYMAKSGYRHNWLKIEKACLSGGQYRIQYTLYDYDYIPNGTHHIFPRERWQKALAVVLPQSQLPVTVTGKILKAEPTEMPENLSYGN